jgi:predicted esterase
MNLSNPIIQTPHQGGRVLSAGKPLEQAQGAMLMVHGRSASAEDILSLTLQFEQDGFAYMAPQAAENIWYPNRFMAPIPENEPWLSSALSFIHEIYEDMARLIPPERILLLGFSQGACLALDYAARHARRYGGLIGLSGALIGPDETPRNYPGSLQGTPVFLGCSDVDPHIPAGRVDDTASILERLGGRVTKRLYPGMGHLVNPDEILAIRRIMQDVLGNQ